MVACERLYIPFDKNKMADVEVPFFGLLSVSTLEQWGLDERNIAGDIAKVTFAYLNITSDNFQKDPYSHLAGYRAYINKYINTTSSISIKSPNIQYHLIQ